MLYRANKLILLVLLPILVMGCLSEEEKLQRKREAFSKSKPELQKQRQEIYNYSKSFIGDSLYKQIYQDMNDSIRVWIDNALNYYQYFDVITYADGKKYQIDNIICYNKLKNRCMTAVLMQQYQKESIQDDIWYFYGVKIRDRWYFFRGATLVLPREYYQKDIHTPLSFETLKLLAAKHVFRGYLKKNKNKKYEINDKFFSDLTSGAWCAGCNTQQQWDSAYMYHINQNWSKKNID